MKLWVTRDKDDEADICGWKYKKGLNIGSDGYWDTSSPLEVNSTIPMMDCMTPDTFKKLFDFTPRKGTCKQYELSLKEIK